MSTLVNHGDLLQLATLDVEAVLNGAEEAGAAIALDRTGTGTSALALMLGAPPLSAFGADSFSKHRALLPGAAIVVRPGLALDIDLPEDFDHAFEAGALPNHLPFSSHSALAMPRRPRS
jgi:2-phospho-L-lactate/phosphoenolpyruvate guanylyltransferase